MVTPRPWDASAAVAACPVIPWTSDAWRFHSRRYPATSPAGSLRISGRFHRGLDTVPAAEAWPALYFALQPHIALAERVRHTEPDQLPRLNRQRLSHLRIALEAVLDCCDTRACQQPGVPGLTRDDLCRRFDYRVPQELAAVARASSVEGIVVPSCSRFDGGNLVLFMDRLRTSSTVVLLGSEDPELYLDRSGERDE